MEQQLWDFYRQTLGRSFTVNVGTSDTLIRGANDRRIALIVNPDSSALLHIIFGATAATNLGFIIQPGENPYVMHIREWGDFVRQEIRGIIEGPSAKTVFFGELTSNIA